MSRMSKADQAAYIGVLAGILMLIAGVTGAATWSAMDEVAGTLGLDDVSLVFKVLAALGSLGGILVIFGACWIGGRKFIIFKKRNKKAGSILIMIGAGFGLIGLIVLTIVILFREHPASYFLGATGIGFLGLVLSLIARYRIK